MLDSNKNLNHINFKKCFYWRHFPHFLNNRAVIVADETIFHAKESKFRGIIEGSIKYDIHIG